MKQVKNRLPIHLRFILKVEIWIMQIAIMQHAN